MVISGEMWQGVEKEETWEKTTGRKVIASLERAKLHVKRIKGLNERENEKTRPCP